MFLGSVEKDRWNETGQPKVFIIHLKHISKEYYLQHATGSKVMKVNPFMYNIEK